MDRAPMTRPGGRAARIGAAISAAVVELLHEPDWSDVTLARVAERAGVHPTTVYRRWPTLADLVSVTIDERLADGSPLPDTGSLAGDVRAHAHALAVDLSGPDGRLLIRAATIVGSIGQAPSGPGRGHALARRTIEVTAMFDRARHRGEPDADTQDYFDYVVGPLYGYALLIPGQLLRRAPVLADRFLASLPSGPGP